MITLEELDRHLSRWQKAVEVAIANVYELYEHPVYRALANPVRGVHAAVTGESPSEVAQACETVRHLLLCGNEMQAVVERACGLRERLPRLFREEKMQEIERLLDGPTIRLPGTDVPLTQRGLLSETMASGRALSLQEMLDTMVPAFEAAKRTIFEVDQAWSTLLIRLDAADAELARLREAGQTNGLGEMPELLALQRKIAAARSTVNLDPLGATRTLEQELSPTLAKVRAGIETMVADLRQAQADLAQAHALQRELTETHARAVAVAGDCREKVMVAASGSPALPLTAGQVEDANGWLAQLDAMMAQAATRPTVKVGVRRWLEAARRHLDHDRAVLRAGQALLDERQELRGRLDALNAKAAGSGLAEDARLADDARAARALLYRRPTPLAQARDLVARYQNGLNARIAAART